MLELAAEESDVPEPSGEAAEWPEWSGYLQHAWHDLRDDRFYGAMGGMGRIYYTALSTYAKDNGIELHSFVKFMQAIDGEYTTYCAEQAKIAASKT